MTIPMWWPNVISYLCPTRNQRLSVINGLLRPLACPKPCQPQAASLHCPRYTPLYVLLSHVLAVSFCHAAASCILAVSGYIQEVVLPRTWTSYTCTIPHPYCTIISSFPHSHHLRSFVSPILSQISFSRPPWTLMPIDDLWRSLTVPRLRFRRTCPVARSKPIAKAVRPRSNSTSSMFSSSR